MNKRYSVVIASNNPEITIPLESDLEVLGYAAASISHEEIARSSFGENPPDVIIVDLTTCTYDTLSTCELLTRDGMIPARTVLTALVSGQSMGQVPLDYEFSEIIIYPGDISELGFRLRRAVHQAQSDNGNGHDTLKVGSLSISPSRYEVKVDDKPVPLSHKEYELLKHLATNPSHVFTREELFVTIWGNGQLGESRTVDVHIRRIRSKIGDNDQQYIKTVRGVGYTFRFENN